MSDLKARFAALSDKAKGRRLKVLAERALEQYDLDITRVHMLSNSWNCVFRVESEQGAWVIRVAAPMHGHSPVRMRSEALLLKALSDQTRLRVPAPLPNRDGELWTQASAKEVPEPRDCVVFSWVRGADLADSIGPRAYRKMGRLIAELHDFGEQFTPPPGFEAMTYDRVFHYPGPITLLESDPDLGSYHDDVEEAIGHTDSRIAFVNARDGVIITHGDLHQWNVKLYKGVAQPIDFEDHQYAAPLLDVATSLYYIRWRDDYDELAAAYRAGYEETRPWVEQEPGEVDRLMFSRSADLFNCFTTDFREEVKDWGRLIRRMGTLARIALEKEPAREIAAP